MPTKKDHIMILFLIFIVSGFQLLIFGEKISPYPITVEKIFGEKIYKSKSFGPFKWDETGHSFTLLKASAKEKKIFELFRYDPVKKKFKKLIDRKDLILPGEKKETLIIEDYSISPDGKMVLIFTKSEYVWRTKTKGNYWIFYLNSKKLFRIGEKRSESSMMFAKFSPDSSRVAYVSDRNIYIENISTSDSIQLTSSGSDTIINGTFDWVYEEEFHMKDGFRWSPDGKYIAFWQFDISGVRNFHIIDYISELYSIVIPIQYPKAGETNSSCRIGTIKVTGGTINWIDFKNDPRMHYLARMEWTDRSDQLIIQRLNRSQNKDVVWIFNIKSGISQKLFTETDKAWLEVVDKFYWIKKGKFLLWPSERDGWRHLYKISRDGKSTRLITSGKFDVISVLGIDHRNDIIYFSASPKDPSQSYLYSVSLSAKPVIKRITPYTQPGTHRYKFSEDSINAIHYYSNFNTPDTIDLIKLPDHKRELLLEDNSDLLNKLKTLSFTDGEFYKLRIGNNTELDCWMIKPPDFSENKKYPVIFNVYGEPWGQTVRDTWKGDTYMWHRMLAQNGYIIMSIDNRGTPAPRGRDFRKTVYKKLGIMTSNDQAKGVKAALKKFRFLDKKRVGVWGWSGGGSMTLNLLFQYPEIYKSGISVAPVTDMRYYDSVYQERYMGLPSENKKGYHDGSPITHAKNLKGKLLLIHGTGDDNVHYQNTEALINKLIEYKKQFSFMAYPNRRHSIRKGKNTRVHLFTLMTLFFANNLAP